MLAVIVISLVIGIIVGFVIGVYAMQLYMRYCILKGTIFLKEDDLKKIKQFVKYDEQKAAKLAARTDRGERRISRLFRK